MTRRSVGRSLSDSVKEPTVTRRSVGRSLDDGVKEPTVTRRSGGRSLSDGVGGARVSWRDELPSAGSLQGEQSAASVSERVGPRSRDTRSLGVDTKTRKVFAKAETLTDAIASIPGAAVTSGGDVVSERVVNQRMRRLVSGYEDMQRPRTGMPVASASCEKVVSVEKMLEVPVARPEYELRTRYAREACQGEADAKAASAPADAMSVTPEMALQWQELSFEEFGNAVDVRRLRDIDREAWTAATQRDGAKDYSKAIAKTEEKLLRRGQLTDRSGDPMSAFGKNLALGEFAEDLKLPVLPSVWDLPFLLNEICADEHPKAVFVWIQWSRGVQMVADDVVVPPTDVANYEPATELLKRQAPVEVQRHLDVGYAMLWSDIQRLYGIKEDMPNNFLPLNMQEKNEERCRMTLDPANSGDPGTPPLNESLSKPPCKLPVFPQLVKSVKHGSNISRGDYVDSFLNHNLRPSDFKYAGFRDYQGRVCALVRMGQGFRNSSAMQQLTTTAMLRMHRRRLMKRGLRCASPEPEYDKAPVSVSPGTGHEMTTSLGYSDDAAMANTTWLSGWFTFLHWIILNLLAGMQLGYKKGKTDPPAFEQIWIGFFISTLAMKWGLPVDWVAKLSVLISPWADGKKKDMTIRGADKVLGSLQHASQVVQLGKGYFSELQAVKNAIGPCPHPGKTFKTTHGVRGMLQMWRVLLENMALTSAFISCKRQTFPHVGFSDASFEIENGWCWAIMGVLQHGRWPDEWSDRIGRGSEHEEIWITELECWALLYMIRAVAPRAARQTLRIKCDNLGAVYILTKMSTRSVRISPIVSEILWLCVVYDIVLVPSHIRSEYNVLCDYGTRQKDKNFRAHVKAYLTIHHEEWFASELKRFPPQVARPELQGLIPMAEERLFVTHGVDRAELDRIRSKIALADQERAVRMQQAIETASC